ncbi:MAG: hypothetical protein JNJ57_02540 [Saprospiraceae bacterium]|nr:hypothetical protein [Saprospiraceae bacterium]
MNFLPTENITYKTHLNEEEIIKRLSDHVETEETLSYGIFNSGSSKPYVGQINDQTFNIKRIISYRNSFLPRIYGIIEKDFGGSTIIVKMRLHTFVIVFLGIWCCFVGIASAASLRQALGNQGFNSKTMIPLGMLLFFYALIMVSFKYESYKSKMDLQTIFEADIVEG